MRKFMKYFLALSLIIACMLFVTACGEKEAELTSISATIDENYTLYLYDDLDTSKITVTAKYSDDKEETVQSSEVEFGKIDTTKVGEQELQITYKEKSTILKINVAVGRVQKVDGNKPTFLRDGKTPSWRIKVAKTGEWKYFTDENLTTEVKEEDLVIPKYVAKNALVTKTPTLTEKGIVTITTTTNEELKICIPNYDEHSDGGYIKISKATWTEDNFYAYKLNVEKLKQDWWEGYNYAKDSEEYRINVDEVDVIKPYLEDVEIATEEVAPAMSAKFVIDKVGSCKLEGEYVSRVVVTGKLLYGQLIGENLSPDCLSIYCKGEKVPFTEKFGYRSFEVLNEKTKEYKFVTKFYTKSDDVALGTEGIICSKDDRGELTGLIIKPGDEVVTTQRDKFNLELGALNEGEEILKGDVLEIAGFPCKILKIKDVTNNKELEKVTNLDSALIKIEVEILNHLNIDRYAAKDMIIRNGEEVEIWRCEDGGMDLANRQIATGTVKSVISKIKADILVNDARALEVGDVIEGLVPGDMQVDNLTDFTRISKIGIATVASVPNEINEEHIFKDVILEIETTSQSQTLPVKSENYFSRECVDFLNACLSIGETVKVYDLDNRVLFLITITGYNFD